MATYRITIVKHLDDGPYAQQNWSNVYHVNAASSLEADLAATGIVDLEKTLYPDNVHIVRYSYADPAVPNSSSSKGIFEAGSRAIGAVATQLPPFNTVMVQLANNEGRPSIMHLRPILDEADVDSGAITTDCFNALQTGWAGPLLARGDVTDESGNLITAVLINLPLKSRQLGWHRRTRPGFRRGWVAV